MLTLLLSTLLPLLAVGGVGGDTVATARSQLIAHVQSGAEPDVAVWRRYASAFEAARIMEPQQQAEETPLTLPKFKWAQRKGRLTITIDIPGPISDEEVEYGIDGVIVKATGRHGRRYGLDLTFFKTIFSGSHTADKASGRLYLTILKQKKGKYWKRLLQKKPSGELKRVMEVDWSNLVDEEDPEADDDDHGVGGTEVKTLTADTFDSWVGVQEIALVQFFDPSCRHCKDFKPEFAKAAQTLREKGWPGRLAKVDAPKEHSLGRRFEIKAFPTLKVFRRGNPHKAFDVGPNLKDEAGIVAYMEGVLISMILF